MSVPAKSDHLMVFITGSTVKGAKKIARALVEAKLAACCNIIKGITSIYAWEGKIEEAAECMIIVKTRQERFSRLVEEVKKRHSYAVPEIIAVPITKGLKGYLSWIDESTSFKAGDERLKAVIKD